MFRVAAELEPGRYWPAGTRRQLLRRAEEVLRRATRATDTIIAHVQAGVILAVIHAEEIGAAVARDRLLGLLRQRVTIPVALLLQAEWQAQMMALPAPLAETDPTETYAGRPLAPAPAIDLPPAA
ncbi:MAG: hypothetical protein HYY04_09345 [Chloroflexi bacterium]|nr:hypothetical protein [Chloroflexota bacterium]